MGAATIAVFYVAFTALLVYFNLSTLDINTISHINAAVSARFESAPYLGLDGLPKRLAETESPGDLQDWLSEVVPYAIYDEQEKVQQIADAESDVNATAMATVGSFNRVLLIRLSAKRRVLEENRFGAFKASSVSNAYPKRVLGPSRLSPTKENTNEQKTPACMPDGSQPCFEWQANSGFNGAGGFTVFIDPSEGRQAYMDRLQQWIDVGFFDLRLGTFVLDLMTYNANTDIWLHRGWSFAFDTAGACYTESVVRGFNLNTFNTNEEQYLEQYVLRLMLWGFVAFFVLFELMKLWNVGFYQHFRHKAPWFDMFCLLMCSIALLTYRILESDDIFHSFQFSQLLDPATMAETYERVARVGQQCEEQQYIIALNLLLVFVRAVVFVTELQSNFGLILQVLNVCASTLAYFLVMFMLIMMGFVFMAYFTFGAGCLFFSDPVSSFITTFSMLTGREVFDDLEETDEVMSFIFYYSFYILFYLVFINVFVSIIMSGYDVVVAKVKEKEDGPLTKLMDEIKHEFVDKIVSAGKAVGGVLYRCPLVDPCAACLWSCVPSCSMPSLGKWFCRKRSTDDEDLQGRQQSAGSTHGTSSKHQKSGTTEVVCVTAFLVNTLVFLTLQVRGQACFNLGHALLKMPVEEVSWTAPDPFRVETLETVHDWFGVRDWSSKVIEDLYGSPKCAVYEEGATFSRLTSVNGRNGCDNTNNAEQVVQLISKMNIGFMNTTFVRLTIQPACFIPIPETRSRFGNPWLRKTPDVNCAEANCVSVLSEQSCQTPDGTSLDMGSIRNIPVRGSATEVYNFSMPETELGPHFLLGGFVVSLGSTLEAAQAMHRLLEDDNWFTPKSASMVFDWVTYNGNLDMFTYNEVSFSLRASGIMEKHAVYTSFPMNINEGGGFYSSERTWILILFSTYIFGVLCQCLEIARRIQLIKRGKTVWKFMQDFFGDVWNFSDFFSLVMAILAIVYYMMFALNGFRMNYYFSVDSELRYQVPNDDEKVFSMPRSVDPTRYLEEDWYIFRQFENVRNTYEIFLTVSAINSFFIAIKVVKYVGQLKNVQVFSDTLDSGKTRNSYFAVVIMLMMSGFALFFHIIFGKGVESLNSWVAAEMTVFTWMVGVYDLDPLLRMDAVTATIWFVMFMLIFYYIATNMFLATMLSVYNDTVGAEDEEKAKMKYRPRKDVVIHYRDRASMLEEIRPENLELKEGEVLVRDLRPDTQPASHGVQKGHILAKVNGEPKLWKEHCKSIMDIIDTGLPDEGEIHLEFVERLHKTDRGWKRFFSACMRNQNVAEAEVSVKPTCKNFWRMEGAVACIAREAHNQGSVDDDDEGDGAGEGGIDEDDEAQEDSGSGDEAHGSGVRKTSEAVRKARRRVRTKKRLEALLFSRWSDGKPFRGTDGAVGTGHGWDAFGGSDELGGQPKEVHYEVDHLEVFRLREEMNRLPIAGQEAWLDCLMSAMEREMDDDCVVTDVLRTSEMQDVVKNKQGRETKPMQEFYRHADEVLKMLEFKANKKYYQYLQLESEQRQEHLRSQNEVLHDYVCELETEFSKVMELIHKNRAKKEVMLTKLAGLLDRQMYRHLEANDASSRGQGALGNGEDDDRPGGAVQV